MVLRSLMKARYDTENLGHFGLGGQILLPLHLPIRRYPDLMVHRILTALLDGTLETQRGRLAAAADRAAKQSSDREVHAMTAERDIEKCYMAEFMTAHVGDTFQGAVTGVTKFGLFVGLPNGVEGLLPVTALPDDRYEYDEIRMTLTGAGPSSPTPSVCPWRSSAPPPTPAPVRSTSPCPAWSLPPAPPACQGRQGHPTSPQGQGRQRPKVLLQARLPASQTG